MSEHLDIRKLSGTSASNVVTGQGYFPVIADLGDGELIVVHRGGSGHMGLGGRLDVCRSLDWGETWDAPVTIADSERDDRNPALGIAPDGTVVLAYHWQGNYDEDGMWKPELGKQDTRVVYSSDGGRSWQNDILMNYLELNGSSPFGKIRSVHGVLHMPIYGRVPEDVPSGTVTVDPGTVATFILRSEDNGLTWGNPSLVALGLNEADFLVLPDDRYLFAARSEKRSEMAIHTCRSSDGGSTWGYLNRVNDSSEHPPDLTMLGNDWILMTFGRRHEPFGVQGIISKDNGESWEERRLLIDDTLPGGDSGYPSTVRQDNGRLATVYYTAGSWDKRWDTYNPLEAACKVICYHEQELIDQF